jgi:hypothetical protein
MNERIKQLAIEANMISPESNGFDRTSLSISQQKFAQLIIKECFSWVNDNVGLMDEETKADLLKHFGVKK